MLSHKSILLQASSVNDQLIESMETGVAWGNTVGISVTALLMAVSLLAVVINFARSR